MADVKGTSAHLIINPAASGVAAFLRRLTRTARGRGIRVRVVECREDARLAALAAADDGAELLAVAGSDGSVAAVAGVAVERGLPLVVVPTGTLNYFARDLGLDLARPLRALDAFHAGQERRVDVGRINGHPFINNVSLGVYAEMLGDPGYRRDKLRVAQTKFQAVISDPELRRALRITPPEEAPLRFSVDPGALRVFVPEGPPASRQVPPLEADWHVARTLRRWLRPTPAVQNSGSDDPQSWMAPDILGPRRPGETAGRGGLEQRRSR